ncbi:MAG: TRAP transporter small permease [Deltaproteobacteria bacterium]|nr:TRAP transporter small permease [Deltaproteobacteria bacterium]
MVKLLDKALSRTISVFLILAMAAMIVLGFLQVVLRNFFGSGISWADVTVRHLVLWVGFFGAVLATIENRHITLDVFSRILPSPIKKYVQSLIYLGSAVVCFVLTHASYKFVASERLMGEILFSGVPVWWAQVVIPVTFGLMGILFVLRSYSVSLRAEHSIL